MSVTLISELRKIDDEAWNMALAVWKDPALRTQYSERANALSDRLTDLADQLQANYPEAFKSNRERISESLLDLNSVTENSDMCSVRLGRIIMSEGEK